MMAPTTPTATNGGQAVDNFRVFTEQGYAAPTTDADSEHPLFVYYSVSVMSNHYTNFESMKSMVVAAQEKFGSRGIPVVYICADTLQRNTREVLYGDTSSKQLQPEERARRNWLNLFNRVIHSLREEGVNPLYEIIDWDALLKLHVYKDIRRFVDTVLCHATDANEFINRFPNAPTDTLESLRQDVLCSPKGASAIAEQRPMPI